MTEEKRSPGPCPFLGNIHHVPAGPEGDDLKTFPLETSAGIIHLKPGYALELPGSKTILRKIRRCTNGEVYGMVEYPDGGLLWINICPAPIPPLTGWQKTELEDAKKKIPREFLVQGDWSKKVGDRVSRGGQMGTIVLMVSHLSFMTAGAIVMKDDGSISIDDSAMAFLDGRVTHDSVGR